MRLAKAASRFDNTVAGDAYDPAITFRCQLAPLDLYKIDGTAVKRRQMSAAPAVVMPARKVIDIDGQRYLVGDGSPDHWMGEVIRRNYVLQGADHLAELNTIQGVLTNGASSSAYASLDFNKYNTDERISSDYLPQYQLFFADSEAVEANTMVKIGAAWYLVKESYRSVSGLRVALANELLGSVVETINFGARTYDPVTDTYTSAGASVKVIRVRWTEHFKYMSQGSTKYEAGDQQVFMPKTVTPKPSDILPLYDGVWHVQSVVDEGGFWGCHVRRG